MERESGVERKRDFGGRRRQSKKARYRFLLPSSCYSWTLAAISTATYTTPAHPLDPLGPRPINTHILTSRDALYFSNTEPVVPDDCMVLHCRPLKLQLAPKLATTESVS